MVVYYRMCSIKSPLSKPAPIQDVFKLTKVCFYSFIEAFKKVSLTVVFLLDYCPQEYVDLIEQTCPFEYEIRQHTLGINETCLLQYRLYEKSNEDKVLFQEYDYLWLPNTGKDLVSALGGFDFVTPYNHPDKYTKEIEPYVKAVGGRYWKQTESTTATFATTRALFDKYKDKFYKYGYLDHERWLEIGRNGGRLFSPLPTLATHMVSEFMVPDVNWDYEIKKYL